MARWALASTVIAACRTIGRCLNVFIAPRDDDVLAARLWSGGVQGDAQWVRSGAHNEAWPLAAGHQNLKSLYFQKVLVRVEGLAPTPCGAGTKS
ncbi:MAG: hypothetical protein CMM86_14445 [Rhodovulum sp.]|nr:hypothetical protein [Rhodovulum sp.]